MVKGLLRAVVAQERALANARGAATELSRQRVEREEVALFLEQQDAARRGTPSTVPAARRARGSAPR
jgi:hypothetical protein